LEWQTSKSYALTSLKKKMGVELVTSVSYAEMLQNFFTPELSCQGTELSNIWFQQDGATAHTARASTEVVREKFSENIISLHSELPWPACSLDLSAYGYFLWGNLKAKVYTVTQRTIDDLKNTIRKHISAISDNLARQALGNP
jgi:hypothetical protein